MKRMVLWWLALATAPEVAAEWLLQPRGNAIAGATMEVQVVQTNDSEKVEKVVLPARMRARWRDAQMVIDVDMEEVPVAGRTQAESRESRESRELRPGEFARATYRVLVPLDFRGPVELALAGGPTGHVTLIAQAAPAVLAAEAIGLDRNVTAAAAALSPHEPMYFLLGTRDGTSAKFQLSMKYRLFDEDGWFGQRFKPLARIHLAYTQTSIWDIGSASRPFRDTSYRPGIFYFEPNAWASANGAWTMSFASGLEHESNGKTGADSRSLNSVFVRPRLRWNFAGDYFLRFDPKVYGYLERGDNADLPRYRGYGDYAIGVGQSDEWLVNSTFRLGTGRHLSTQVDASWRIRQRIFANASGFLYAQYFNGYGESLLDYNVKRRAQFRIGFGIVR